MQVTICMANCVGQTANCSYPKRVEVSTARQLQETVKFDHVCAEFKGNYRSIENFQRSDVIVMDIDNDHSENPVDWVTPEKLEGLFPNMEYMLAPSRHHLLPKENKSARPRYHLYFAISECTDAKAYGELKRGIQKAYPFFDDNALDAARFIFGAECEEVIYHEGWMTIDEEIECEVEDFDDCSKIRSLMDPLGRVVAIIPCAVLRGRY
jgi:putative DNA primase/helicase